MRPLAALKESKCRECIEFVVRAETHGGALTTSRCSTSGPLTGALGSGRNRQGAISPCRYLYLLADTGSSAESRPTLLCSSPHSHSISIICLVGSHRRPRLRSGLRAFTFPRTQTYRLFEPSCLFRTSASRACGNVAAPLPTLRRPTASRCPVIMAWELSRRRLARAVNSKFIFGRIVRRPFLRPPLRRIHGRWACAPQRPLFIAFPFALLSPRRLCFANLSPSQSRYSTPSFLPSKWPSSPA